MKRTCVYDCQMTETGYRNNGRWGYDIYWSPYRGGTISVVGCSQWTGNITEDTWTARGSLDQSKQINGPDLKEYIKECEFRFYYINSFTFSGLTFTQRSKGFKVG